MKKLRFLSLCCTVFMMLGCFTPVHAACSHEKSEYYIVDVHPNCYKTGVGHYFCIHCDEPMGSVVISATEFHLPTGPYITTKTHHYRKCITEGCPAHVDEDEHNPGRIIADQEPTCGTAGVGHTICDVCDRTIEIEVRIPPTEMHEEDVHNPVVDIPPTCTKEGKGHIICSVCKKTTKPLWTFPATDDHKPGNYVVVENPTCSTPGKKVATCITCDLVVSTIDIAPTEDHVAGPWKIVRPATTIAKGLKEKHCKYCDTLMKSADIPIARSTTFGDVKDKDFYYAPVQWAVENDITAGTSDNTFSPKEACTRAQIATFLWRAAGKPTPTITQNPFTDVKKGDYYYNAVLWAVENGITSGTSDNTFSPKEACTRGQIATFLWRAAGKPTPTITQNPFADAKKSDFYYTAVLWAVENNITSGTSKTTFSPKDACTRGQIVTFLYRNYN